MIAPQEIVGLFIFSAFLIFLSIFMDINTKLIKMSQLVKNFEKLTRPIVFNGLKSRTCSPTDLDWLLEYYGKYLIIGEVKEENKDITVGQSITTTRICDAWNKVSGNIGIIVFSQHNPDDSIILLSETIINKVYINGKWVDMSEKNITVKEFLTKFANKYNISHMKNLD